MWIISSQCSSLPEYMAFVKFLKREFVIEGFITFCCNQGLLHLCCVIDEDEEVNVKSWFPNCQVEHFDDANTELDQPTSLEGCMLISMHNSDLIQTKNLKNTRMRLCERLVIGVSGTSAVLER